MKSLLALYFGTILLAYLSQKYHPVRETLHMRGSRHFFFARTDVFVVIIIFWLSALSFLRTGYNDSPLSSKIQKIIADSGILALDAVFSTAFRPSVCSQQRKAVVLPLLFQYGLIRIFDVSYLIGQAADPYVLTARNRPRGILQIS